MTTFDIKRGDTRPSLKAQLLDDAHQPKTLQQADSVRFIMKDAETDDVAVDNGGVIISETNGTVAYEWVDGDTSDVGQYYAEFEVTYSDDSSVETFPNDGYITVYVNEDIA